jgi:prevent-host-death family protein
MARTMSAAEFKARCLQAMDEVAETGEPVVVTKRGRPVAQLVPIARKPKTLRGFLKGRVRARGDLVAPTGAHWRADRP